MSDAAALEIAVRQRAHAVRRAGSWIGLFEWAVWATVERLRVHVLFGESSVDVLGVFAPMKSLELGPASRDVYVVAAELLEGFSLVPGGGVLPRVNHWLPAVLVGSEVRVRPARALEFSARQRLGQPDDEAFRICSGGIQSGAPVASSRAPKPTSNPVSIVISIRIISLISVRIFLTIRAIFIRYVIAVRANYDIKPTWRH